MYRLETKIDTKSPEFRENQEHMQRLVEEFKERLREAKKGGPPAAHKKHKTPGKLAVSDIGRGSQTSTDNMKRGIGFEEFLITED